MPRARGLDDAERGEGEAGAGAHSAGEAGEGAEGGHGCGGAGGEVEGRLREGLEWAGMTSGRGKLGCA